MTKHTAPSRIHPLAAYRKSRQLVFGVEVGELLLKPLHTANTADEGGSEMEVSSRRAADFAVLLRLA